MLVKFIAMGLSPPVWKNLVHHVRSQIPEYPFSTAVFTSPEELALLQQEDAPGPWGQDGPDFVLSDLPQGEEGVERLRFLARLQAGRPPQPVLVLTLPALEAGLRQLVPEHAPVGLVLDTGASLTLGDPDLLLRAFPGNFPRVAVHPYLDRLCLLRPLHGRREVLPSQLAPGTVLGLADLVSMDYQGEHLAPLDWLKRVLRAEKLRMPRQQPLGLIREAKGLFLFPGVPLQRLRGVELGGARFAQIVDLGQMTPQSPHFSALLGAVQQTAAHVAARWAECLRRLRQAEAKRDLLVACAGGPPLLNETLARQLGAQGYARAMALPTLRDDLFREPALLIQLGELAASWGNQVEEPVPLSAGRALAQALAPLGGMAALEGIPFDAQAGAAPPLTAGALAEQQEQWRARAQRARAGRELAEKRLLLQQQEQAVLAGAGQRLDALLAAKDSMLVWNGTPPGQARQALVFSHDQEEAGAVLQALTGVGKKRWFDLSPYVNAEALQALPLETVREYAQGGVLIITASSRERLRDLHGRLGGDLRRAEQAVQEGQAALAFYSQEEEKAQAALQQLVRGWVWQSVQRWLEASAVPFQDALDQVRRRHERQWLARALIRRVVIVASSAENRSPLVQACRALYPAFLEEQSLVLPYAYEPLAALPPEQEAELTSQAQRQKLAPAAARALLEQALGRQNEALLRDYLRVLAAELRGVQADLILVEHTPAIAGRLLEGVRAARPSLRAVPALLILPEAWLPPPDAPLPWPRTRVVPLRRLGALVARDCAEAIRAVHPA